MINPVALQVPKTNIIPNIIYDLPLNIYFRHLSHRLPKRDIYHNNINNNNCNAAEIGRSFSALFAIKIWNQLIN